MKAKYVSIAYALLFVLRNETEPTHTISLHILAIVSYLNETSISSSDDVLQVPRRVPKSSQQRLLFTDSTTLRRLPLERLHEDLQRIDKIYKETYIVL